MRLYNWQDFEFDFGIYPQSRLTGKTTWMVGDGSDGRWTPSPSFLFQSFCRLPFVFMYQKIESLWLIDILQIGFKAPPVQNSLQVEHILQECILWLAICCIALLRPLNSHNKLGQRTFLIWLTQATSTVSLLNSTKKTLYACMLCQRHFLTYLLIASCTNKNPGIFLHPICYVHSKFQHFNSISKPWLLVWYRWF